MQHHQLPEEVHHVLLVLYDHFMRTGQRRYWVVTEEAPLQTLRQYKHLDLYEFIYWQQEHRVLITGLGIDYVRRTFGERPNIPSTPALPGHIGAEAAPVEPVMPPTNSKRTLNARKLLAALTDELEHSNLTPDERKTLEAKIQALWAEPSFVLVLDRTLQDF